MNLVFRNCLYSSLALHIFLFLLLSVFSGTNNIKKPFVVFGAHSKKQYHAFYKTGRQNTNGTAIPFVSGARSGRGKNLRTHRSGGVKSSGGKNAISKKRATARVKSAKVAKTVKPVRASRKSKLQKSAKRVKTQKLAHKIELPEVSIEKDRPVVKEKKYFKNKKKLDVVQPAAVAEAIKAPKKVEEKIEKELNKKEPIKEEPVKADIVVDDKKIVEVENEPVEDEASDSGEGEDLDTNETSSVLVLSLAGNVDPGLTFYQKCIQKEVERLWKPPIGVPKSTTCRINFIVDRKGNVKNFEIVKRSSVLIYDLSILRIAHLFKFDQKLWGKSFAVDFCQ